MLVRTCVSCAAGGMTWCLTTAYFVVIGGGGGWKTLKTAIALICSAVVERKNVWWYIYKVVTF